MISLENECRDAKRIAISGHVRPDGDCVGSVMGLSLYLKKKYPEKTIDVYLEKASPVFDCIKGMDMIRHDVIQEDNYDLFFALDTAKDRLGAFEHLFDMAKRRINIDHHISNYGSGDSNYIVPTASSTSELIYNLIDEKYLDLDIAKAIYIGIIHDTGVFQYSNTSAQTLEIASKLIQFPFPFADIIQETFYEKTYVQTQILGRAILESILFMDGRCAVSCVDRKMMDFYKVTSADLEGIVNQLRNIKGVDCAIFLYEINTMEYKVSMRSNDEINVSKIATLFGGGGHKKAAGCTMNGTFHDVVNNISVQIDKQLKE